MLSILLQSPFDGPWLQLDRPSGIITARRPPAVRGCLDAAEAAARRGSYVAGFVTYEAAAAFGLPVCETPEGGLPLACFGIFAPANVRRVDVDPPAVDAPALTSWLPSIDRDAYIEALRRIRDFIAAGDTYQLNFTFRLRAPFAGDPRRLFEHLVAAQRGLWSAYVELDQHAICSASPELFFRLQDGRIECRPMKGTLPRALAAGDDLAQAEHLRSSPKNRSENIMIVDLMRNDLGRVARTGSVHATSLFDVERYPAQWQMTSSLVADVGGSSLADIFAALFPSGSVTGAPKTRSMEIIRDLEASPRGIYTGAIGLIDPQGRAHFNVAIRTVVVSREGQSAEFGVGSGIVWESQEADEFDECRNKAAILTARPPVFELLETLSWDADTGYTLLDRHLERLHRSAEYFGFEYREDDARRALDAAVEGRAAAARVRLLVNSKGVATCEVADLVARTAPWRAALAVAPVSPGDVFLYHKTTRRIVYDEARRSRPDADAVLLWNDAGDVTEGTEANVVAAIDGRLVTPPVECGLLAGTMRAELLAKGEIAERRISRDDLRRATRVWLINSVRGWMDAELI